MFPRPRACALPAVPLLEEPGRSFARTVALVSAVATLIAIGAATLVYLYRVVLWLVVGFVLISLFDSMASALERRLPGPRGLWVAVSLALVVGTAGGAIALASVPLVEQGGELLDGLPRLLARVDRFVEHLGHVPQPSGARLDAPPSVEVQQAVTERLPAVAATGVPLVLDWVDGAFDAVGVVFFAAFVAAAPDEHRRGLLRLVPPHVQPRVEAFLDAAGESLRGWLGAVGVGMAIVGVLVTSGLFWLKVDTWLVFGLLAAALQLVPYAGSLLGAIGPILECLLDGDARKAAAVAALYLGAQVVMTNLVTPYLVRRRTEIPGSLALASILGLGAVAGVLGIVVAVPLVAIALAAAKAFLPSEPTVVQGGA